MQNQLLKIIRNPETGMYGMYLRIENQYRLIWPDCFFKKLWAEDEWRYIEVGPDLLMYDLDVRSFVVFDKDLGRKEVSFDLEELRENFKAVYEEYQRLYQSEATFVYDEYDLWQDDISNYLGSIDTLFDTLRDVDNLDNKQFVPFTFEFTAPHDTNSTPYRIKIGENEFSSSLDDQFTDFNRLRADIELAVLIDDPCRKDHHIHLEWSGLSAKLTLEIQNIRCKWNGIRDVMKVTQEPEYSDDILIGWCDGQQVVRSLYLGLLQLGVMPSEKYDPSRHDGLSWDEFRLATYNQLQSCILEHYIIGRAEHTRQSYPRQRWMSSVEEMEKDYAELLEKLK